MEENKKRRKRDIVKETVSDTLHKAKESLIYPYYKALDKFNRTFSVESSQQITLNWDKFMHIRIRVFHAQNHAEIAKIYTSGQQDVLKEFNVTGVTSAKKNSWENENSYIFVAENVKTGEIGAGMRLDVADAEHKLPLETALENIVPDLSQRIHRFDNIIAEACGWWVKKTFSERRLPKHLLISALAIAPKFQIKYILGFPHQGTKKITDSLGFMNVRDLGNNNASFFYPNENYVSTVVEIDAVNLTETEEHEKEKIVSLRKSPVQTITIELNGYTTKIDFDLRLM
jgi:hypothetical protein